MASNDWAALLRARLEGHGPRLPMDGLTRGGWRLVYASEPSRYTRISNAASSLDNHLFSLGLAIGKDDNVVEVYWGSPAFKAGIAPGMTLVAVNARAYSPALLRDAIKDAQTDKIAKNRPARAQIRYVHDCDAGLSRRAEIPEARTHRDSDRPLV